MTLYTKREMNRLVSNKSRTISSEEWKHTSVGAHQNNQSDLWWKYECKRQNPRILPPWLNPQKGPALTAWSPAKQKHLNKRKKKRERERI